MRNNQLAVRYAILAAVCYGVCTPLSKWFLHRVSPTLMASLLYLGAGAGMALVAAIKTHQSHEQKEARLSKRDLPYIIGMILLDIAAPILLMLGLSLASPATVSLLNNFEIVATSIIAFVLFKETIGKRLWVAIGLITIASILLSFDGFEGVSFSTGALFALLACICWGFENNFTRMLSLKDPLEIVIIKGLGSGLGALAVAAATGGLQADWRYAPVVMLLGFFAYGLSIYFYILAQRDLGAARTSAYYAGAPFVGVLVSFFLFHQQLTATFILALLLMLIGTYYTAFERHNHTHRHISMSHEHGHAHEDGHHTHIHHPPIEGYHSHFHTHEMQEHAHIHTPDLHHSHKHDDPCHEKQG